MTAPIDVELGYQARAARLARAVLEVAAESPADDPLAAVVLRCSAHPRPADKKGEIG